MEKSWKIGKQIKKYSLKKLWKSHGIFPLLIAKICQTRHISNKRNNIQASNPPSLSQGNTIHNHNLQTTDTVLLCTISSETARHPSCALWRSLCTIRNRTLWVLTSFIIDKRVSVTIDGAERFLLSHHVNFGAATHEPYNNRA